MSAVAHGPTEHQIQAALFEWAAWNTRAIPHLQMLHAIPNGAGLRHTTKTARSGKVIRFSPEANKLRREGLRAGIPDVHWPIGRGGYLSLYIEHKRGANGLSDAQSEIADMLMAEGNLVVVSRSVDESIAAIMDYWGMPITFNQRAGKALLALREG